MTSNSSPHHANVVPSEVGWQFVPQYYTFVNKEPHRLHCFYSKNSTFIHGTEGEDVKSCFGQQEIHKKITSIGFENCKVFIHSVDAQSSANGGIIIQVIGEMSNHGETWRKFVQTFFLAEQPNGYFVLNDIFRFLKEESVDDGEGSDAEAEAPPQPQSATPVTGTAVEPSAQPAAPLAPEPAYEQPREATPAPPPIPVVVEDVPVAIVPVDEAPKAAEPSPEPIQAPAPVPEQATQTAQPNGHASEPEAIATPAPASTQPSPRPTQPPALSAPSPAPSAASTATAAAAATPPQPTATAAPQQPRSWASLAASNSKKWGPVAQVSETVAPSSSPGSGSLTPGATTPTPSVAATQQHHGRPNHQRNEHPALIAAQSVTTAHCFVKGVTEVVSQTALETTLVSRFGPIKDLEILRNKACAFLEFQSVDSARKAIIASLNHQQGGEGGVWIESGGEQYRIFVETKKDKADRGPSRPYRGGAPAGQQVNGGDRGGNPQGGGNFRGRTGGRGGGRGGAQK